MIRVDFLRFGAPTTRSKLSFGVLGWVAVFGSSGCQSAEATEPTRGTPVLFAERAACAVSRPEIALHLARLTEETADHQMQQLAFFPAAGVDAVNHLAEALACFQISESSADISRVIAKLESWRARTTAEFQSHRLRLKRCLETEDLARARVEVLALKAFFANRPRVELDAQPYYQWLNAEDRQLQSSSPSK